MKSLVQLFALLMVWSCTGTTQKDIVFEARDIQAKQVTILRYDYKKREYTEVKTMDIGKNGTFTYEDQFKEPIFYRVQLDDQPPVRIAVERAGKFSLSMEENELSAQSDAGGISDFGKTMDEINNHFFADLKKEYEVAVEKQDMARLEVLEKQKDELLIEFVAAIEKAVRDMGPSARAYQALSFFDDHKNFEFLKEMATAFEASLPKSHLTQFISNRVERAAQVQKGAQAPSFKTLSLEGEKISLENYRGKYLLIDFWASWCLACRAENPKLVILYDKMKDKGLEMLSISRDEEEAAYKKAMEKDQLSWTQVWDRDNSLASLYLISSLPANFLLDPEGMIIAKNVTADQLEEILR